MTTPQSTLFDYAESQQVPEAMPPNNNSRRKPEINARAIEAELQELTTARVRVKLNKHLDIGVSIRETDTSYSIQFNPNRIRTPGRLEAHMNFCREDITHFH